MNTISEQVVGHRRRRRTHSDEFKATVVASCLQPGMSMAAVAIANGINANLLRRWVHEAEMHGDADQVRALPVPKPAAPATAAAAAAAFVPVALSTPSTPPDIRIELRRGAIAITVTWPTLAASECAAWMRELLR